MASPARQAQSELASPVYHTHVQFGWWSLFVYAAVGLTLEALHGFKIVAYLGVSNETRRLMWTLAHAHGAVLSIVNIVFGLSGRQFPLTSAAVLRRASWCLIVGSLVLPGGFFLGGLRVYGGDPSAGIFLVPAGAIVLLAGLAITARHAAPARDAQSGRLTP